MTGVVDILMHHRLPVPRDADYVMVVLAFSVEALLFKFHLHGRNNLDVALHTLLLYAVYGCIVALLLEMRFRRSLLALLMRCFFVFLQGTWFWHLGFILYPAEVIPGAKPWNPEVHENVMVASMVFCWHAIGIVIFILAIGGLVGCYYRIRYGDLEPNRFQGDMQMTLIKKDANGHTVVNLHDEDDTDESDVEYQRAFSKTG